MISDAEKRAVFDLVSTFVDKYAYSRPSNIAYPSRGDLSQEGKLASWGVIMKWEDDNIEHMRKSATARGFGAMKDALRKANMVGPAIHNNAPGLTVASLDAVIDGGCHGDATLYDKIISDIETPRECAIASEDVNLRINLLKVIDGLGEPWRYVILTRYYRNEKLKTVATNLGISETRVCQLEKQAIEHLKEAVEEAGIEW